MVTVDIEGAFLKAKVPDLRDLIVKVSGDLMLLMYEINPSLKSDDQQIYRRNHSRAPHFVLHRPEHFFLF
jgi:hypothetical protein